MGRYGIDYESVREAAEILAKKGEPITVERIRQTLGSGSMTTLGKHLRLWRRQTEPQAVNTDALPNMINAAAQSVWANLSQAADERIAQAQLATQTTLQQVQSEAESALAALKADKTEAAKHHQREQKYAQDAYQKLTAQMALLQERCDASESARHALLAENGALIGRLEQMQHQLKAARDEGQGVQQAFAQASAQRDRQAQAQQKANDLALAANLEHLRAVQAEATEQKRAHTDALATAHKHLATVTVQLEAKSRLVDAVDEQKVSLAQLTKVVAQATHQQMHDQQTMIDQAQQIRDAILQMQHRVIEAQKANDAQKRHAEHKAALEPLRQAVEALRKDIAGRGAARGT